MQAGKKGNLAVHDLHSHREEGDAVSETGDIATSWEQT